MTAKSSHEGELVLIRIVFLRSLAFIYFVAFSVAFFQNIPLIGADGLTPAASFLEAVLKNSCKGNTLTCMRSFPTIFWFVECSDENLNLVAGLGMALSLLVLVLGSATVPIMVLLWAMYTSLVNVGQSWFGFGWESQLLETGFLAIWLANWLWPFPRCTTTPSRVIVAWCYRWLIFRIMMGAGLIKIRGDECWRDFTVGGQGLRVFPPPLLISFFRAFVCACVAVHGLSLSNTARPESPLAPPAQSSLLVAPDRGAG